ncbi:hypothetical protein OG394_13855 [Kribbella sp. NBC_01245]|uniref:hypothetical protein n=1 Tax=Kribbella sp. NBC_01245 TaxID=2903578 RepID=UPI002E27D356|nr:hypothetical protein [Kribbella sp. NBC_01245]
MTATSPPDPDAFVVRRSDRAELKAALNLIAVVGIALLAILLVIALFIRLRGGSGSALLVGFWQSVVGPLTIAAVLALCGYFAWNTAKNDRTQETDTDGVNLVIDHHGLYLGGRWPKATPWADIREVSRILLPSKNADGSERWIPHLVVITVDPDDAGELPPSPDDWGPIRRWPGSTESFARRTSYQDLVDAIHHASPTTLVTDRGRHATAKPQPEPKRRPKSKGA